MKNGKFIDFDDGTSQCMSGWKVHKFEGIAIDEDEEEVAAEGPPEAAEPKEEEEEAPLTRFNGSHFIMQDNNKKGGRWFEANVRQSNTKG